MADNEVKVEDLKWKQMDLTQRLIFVGKIVLGFFTMGFMFPHILD